MIFKTWLRFKAETALGAVDGGFAGLEEGFAGLEEGIDGVELDIPGRFPGEGLRGGSGSM